MALAIYNGVPVPLHFPLCFYHILLDCPYQFETMRDGWPSRDRSIGTTQLHTFDLDFSFSFRANGSTYSSDMISRINDDIYSSPERLKDSFAKSVTSEPEVQSLYRQYDTYWRAEKSVSPQLSAFQNGLLSVFPRDNLKILTPKALKDMATGVVKINFEELRKGTRYIDYSINEYVIKWFWETLNDFTEEESKKFLSFLTGNDRLPVPTGHTPLMSIYRARFEGEEAQRVSH
jgi:hypothetical protein